MLVSNRWKFNGEYFEKIKEEDNKWTEDGKALFKWIWNIMVVIR